MHVIAAKAVCFKEAMSPEFKRYQETIVANARALCDKMASEGFRVVSGGTETHLFMLDLRPNGISGSEAQSLLESVGINVNMNEIPYDETPPTVTSGIRLGTPAVTTRGMRPEHMDALGALISRALKNRNDVSVLDSVRAGSRELLEAFPLYPYL
jgi:glycine hydroxymethyltransferase